MTITPSHEATLDTYEGAGLMPVTEGWYVMNLAESLSFTGPRGSYLPLEGADIRFPQFGINVHVLQPGEATLYNRE